MRRLLLALLAAGLLAAQEPPIAVSGAVKQPLTLTRADLAKLPRASARLKDTVYEGVWLHEILKKAGVPQGSEMMHGKPLAGNQGPFRIVASKDKPGARSIRMLTRLEVVQLRK